MFSPKISQNITKITEGRKSGEKIRQLEYAMAANQYSKKYFRI